MLEVLVGMMSFLLLGAAGGAGFWLGRRFEAERYERLEQSRREAELRRSSVPEGMTREQMKEAREQMINEQNAYRAMINFSAEEAYRNAGAKTRGDT